MMAEGIRVVRQYSMEQAKKFADLIEEFRGLKDDKKITEFIENNYEVYLYKKYHNSIMNCISSMNKALGSLDKYTHYTDEYVYFVSDNNTAADIIQYHFIGLEFVEFVKANIKPIKAVGTFSSSCEIYDVELIKKVLRDI